MLLLYTIHSALEYDLHTLSHTDNYKRHSPFVKRDTEFDNVIDGKTNPTNGGSL